MRKKKEKKPAVKGRPPKIDENEKKKVIELSKLGLTDEQICVALGFTRRALQYVKAQDRPFFLALRESKLISDERVEKSLYERAIGYEHYETKYLASSGKLFERETIKHYPPDVDAAIFWLKNRKPKDWKDKHDLDLGKDANGAIQSIASVFRRRYESEAERLAKGEDPALVLFGRSHGNGGNGNGKG